MDMDKNELKNEDLMEDLLEEDVEILTLQDEDGNDLDFEILDLIEYEGDSYVVLLPAEEDADEVLILKIEDSDDLDPDEESYVAIDDDETLDAVFEIFKEKFSDIFVFTDEE